MQYNPEQWSGRLRDALILLIAVSVIARFAYSELRPVLPALIVALVLLALLRLLLRR
jgi:hypothetical protein